MDAPKRDWLDRATLVVALLGVGLGALSLSQTDRAIAISNEQLNQSRAAFLAFNKGSIEVDFKPDGCGSGEIGINQVELTNFGNSPALNVKLTWYPALSDEWRDDSYCSPENKSEISPFHLGAEQSTKISMANLPAFLNPKIGGGKTAWGVFVVDWAGIDQKRHYTKQQFNFEWIPGPNDKTEKPVGTLKILIGAVVAHDQQSTEH